MSSTTDVNTSLYEWCVVMPTYNNAGTLKKVLEEVLAETASVIVVNDGSTDGTLEILKSFENRIDLISYSENKGKGNALRKGFKRATELGFTHAISIDSDGQHFAFDIPEFVKQIDLCPDALVIGARNMNSENVPGKSSFGNKFSNFWFKFETGIELTDTQSGFRLYPLHAMRDLRYFTKKFEFEIEVIVKSAWKGIPVINIPIHIHYEPGEKRITHFRPFRDFSRISVLNTYLVILAVVYYIPLRFFKNLSYRSFIAFLKDQFLKENESTATKAVSIGFGIFMGIFPVWGFQMLLGLMLAQLFKLNKAIFLVAANISVPPLVPFILFLSYELGGLFISNSKSDLFFSHGITLETVKENALQYFIGAVALAVICGLVAGLLAYIAIRSYRGNKDFADDSSTNTVS